MRGILFVAFLATIISCNPKIAKTSATRSFLALGDSYTIGESVPTEENFPFQLFKQLNKNSTEFTPPTIIAKTGWTSAELLAAIRQSELKQKFDLVTLLIGVNNQYRNYSLSEYKTEFEELLKIAIDLAGNKKDNVVVISIPDWGVTPFAKQSNKTEQQIGLEIDSFNKINREVTAKYDVLYIDITPESRQAKADLSLLATDGLHPSGKMYKMWVDQILAEKKF